MYFPYSELSVHVNKQTNLPAYLRQLDLQKIKKKIPIRLTQMEVETIITDLAVGFSNLKTMT